ncbi:kinesin-domain-containing protein [Suillus clintonianus]|uniref:kinesin-domain-containing protein n=1 Tax=Suillus clintonianus TaxID=1904413 RepID=UPI001B872905|nr:kinesin-domain-containing protein [Suillus clintonianus]KAG2155501.1 kinesin-domain-containing protein [Suillus clintonianus]
MATRSKIGTAATRASTRTKTPVPPPSPPAGIKTIRARVPSRTTAQTEVSKARTTGRKPLANRANSPDAKLPAAKKVAGTRQAQADHRSSAEREPVMAYLRIRPHLGDDEPMSMPYLTPLSDTSVQMTDPTHDGAGSSRPHIRVSAVAPSSIYRFSHVFLPETQQAEFFAKTTLPLVRDLLDGQNGLLFAYGVTNSGKTYTIQGGNGPDSAGILPRTLDVIFNSVEGLHSDGRFRPVRLYGVEEADPSEFLPPMDIDMPTDEPRLAEVLAEHLSNTDAIDIDPTIVKLDRNYEYSIWVSYAEVYNEKVYDLLAEVTEDTSRSQIPRPNTNVQVAHPLLLTRKALTVKPSPASDALDESGTGSAGKYIAGLRYFRVTTAAQAKALVKLGQLHRRVFGTLANSQSSRSHGMVTIKVLRGHRGDRDDPSSLQISRLTLVDLAGSERTKHTQTTGDRLKEAGNINKSLMVLGQCMEVMRSNQKRLAQSLANPGRTDTRDVKRALAVVPFRHSKVTEVLMDYFVGDGRVVMIVNINPYDTGFEENSHVMKFSALAREVSTTVNNAPVPRVQINPSKQRSVSSALPRAVTRKVTISSLLPNKKVSEAHLEVLEEDEEAREDGESEEDDDEPINPLVDALFDEIEDLRLRLYEAEMRCIIVEAETREDVMKEMEERMREIEKTHSQRLMSEVERNERKMDAKIDMLHQAGLIGSPQKRQEIVEESEESGEIEHEDVDFEDSDEPSDSEASRSSSPLYGKGKANTQSELTSNRMMGTDVDVEGAGASDQSEIEQITEEEEEDGVEDDPISEDDESDDYAPPAKAKSRPIKVAIKPLAKGKVGSPAATTGRRSTRTVSLLEKQLKDISLLEDGTGGADDSITILPNRKARAAYGGPDVVFVPGKDDIDITKKKKR